MTGIEQAVLLASEQGRTPSLMELGGEEAVLLAPGIAEAGFFGDVAGALVSDWNNLTDKSAAEAFISGGLRSNPDRLAISHAVAILTSSTLELRPYVFALDSRVRDMSAHPILRAEAAAGLMRFALCNRHWKSSAISALYAIDPGQDVLADEMLCRLTAIAFEQFNDSDVLQLLTEYAARERSSAQAAYELGLVEIGRALTLHSLSEIADGFDNARKWLAKSLNANEERRDSKMYLLLVQILIPLAREHRTPSAELADELREVALVRQMWDAPAPGQDWLLPPREAELEWIPVVDEILRTSVHLAQASWLDASRVLDTVLRLYQADRAIRPGAGSVANFVRPWIEAGFVRERGLLSHLDQWLEHAGSQQIDRTAAQTLRSNINRLAAGAPPGK
jgi:hypothetical protein